MEFSHQASNKNSTPVSLQSFHYFEKIYGALKLILFENKNLNNILILKFIIFKCQNFKPRLKTFTNTTFLRTKK